MSDEEQGGDVVAFPGQHSGDGGESEQEPERGPVDIEADEDFEDFLTGASALDDYTREDYVRATTEEYRDLADAIAKAAEEDVEMQAVAASMPGLESGVVGFDDVAGEVPEAAEQPPSDTAVRFATGLLLIAIFLTVLALGGVWFGLFVLVASFLAVGEFYATFRRVGYVPLALFGLLGTIAVMAAGWYGSPGAVATAVGLTVLAIIFWYALVPRRRPLENAAVTILGVVWIPTLLVFAMFIIKAPRAQSLVIALVGLTALFDAGSYFAGRTFGRTQLAPRLSPNKTVEGAVGGLATALVAGVALWLIPWFRFSLGAGLGLAGLVAVFGLAGDLAESMIKRAVGVKDMGTVLPGHGGLLDRVDSFIFTIPVGYLFFSWLGYLA